MSAYTAVLMKKCWGEPKTGLASTSALVTEQDFDTGAEKG